ncbi:hypothetical protein PF008_g14954 [Phytophthora fragariae]|uniref:Integrase catalytic domain-containing protein n=1 Tax=Phytophthora fragariae TaxID=53985 RepID=A0A6G0RGW8_9STRA|nr:hypothetical protein PF008_g14954 [Phytophthora fragariae]
MYDASDVSSVEWIFDSGSQANVCGDLPLFTTIREDQTSRLDFANGTTEHTTICGSVLLRIVNQATGELEDRLVEDVVYTSNAKVNIISLGYLQTTGKYKLTCSPDQQIAWLSKPGTTLKFMMRENIYRLRAEQATGVMVMAALKQRMDSKKAMELLHQRFGHLGMDSVQTLSKKLDVGVKLNENGLTPYEFVACAASKAKRMHHARIPVRKSGPLETLMMDVCTINEETVEGSIMFLCVTDECTRYKWAFLLKEKSEATFHIKVLLNRLRTRFRKLKVQLLLSDQGGEFLTKPLEAYCDENGIVQRTTNAYSPQENGVAERANGVFLPRVRAMLASTQTPNILWGEAFLHIVTTLNWLPTRPLGLVSPHRKLFQNEPDLEDLRTWGCLAHVRIPPESRQRKEKLEPRARLCTLLGYSESTLGYKFIDLKTAQVVTARRQNVRFHEEFTTDGTYMKHLLENAFMDGAHELPDTVPVARIRTSMETYLPGWDTTAAAQEKRLEIVSIAGDPQENMLRSSGRPESLDGSGLDAAAGTALPLHAKLLTMGFERLDSDYGLYLPKVNGEVKLLLTVYVDDLLLMGPRAKCLEVAASLQETFELTTMGTVKYLLGVEILINRPQREIVCSQRQCTTEVFKRFHMSDCNGCATPEATPPSTATVAAATGYLPYRELVSALQYLVSASRPDIAHTTRHLGKFLANYDHTHYAQAKRVLRYIKATCDYELVMTVEQGDGVRISCYSDADYANDPEDRRSINGYVTMLDGNVVSYASRKQEINALSTCEAEYVAMAEATKDLLWLAGLCNELSWKHPVPLLLGDNQEAIALTAKPGKHSKSKHIDNKYHMVRLNVELQRLTTQHVGTEAMVADVMTKALSVVKFTRFRQAMNVLPIVAAPDTATVDEATRDSAGSSTAPATSTLPLSSMRT